MRNPYLSDEEEAEVWRSVAEEARKIQPVEDDLERRLKWSRRGLIAYAFLVGCLGYGGAVIAYGDGLYATAVVFFMAGLLMNFLFVSCLWMIEGRGPFGLEKRDW